MDDQAIASVAETIKSISHPIRLKILCLLLDGEKSVSDIHDHFPSSYANVSQHIQKLLNQGLLKATKKANFIYYAIADERTREMMALLQRLYCPPDTTSTMT